MGETSKTRELSAEQEAEDELVAEESSAKTELVWMVPRESPAFAQFCFLSLFTLLNRVSIDGVLRYYYEPDLEDSAIDSIERYCCKRLNDIV